MAEQHLDDVDLGTGRTCFVISPIGSKHAPIGTDSRVSYDNSIQIWEKVIEPACKQFGLAPIRADKMSQPGEITEQVFELLRDSDVVIADLSGGNANVMYELGLRHTRDLVTVQIGEYERLPFDVNTIRTVQFTRSEAGFIDLRNELVAALRSGLRGEGSQLTPTRVWQGGAPLDSDAVARAVAESGKPDDSDVGDDDAPGFMDLLAEGEAAVTAISDSLEKAGELVEEIGNLSEESAAAIAKSDEQGKGFAGRLLVAQKLADNLGPPADGLEAVASDFGQQVDSLVAMVQYVTARLQSGEEDVEDAREFIEGMLSLAAASEGSNVGTTVMASAARDMKNISRVLRDPGNRIARALNRFIESSNRIAALAPPLQALADSDGGDSPPLT